MTSSDYFVTMNILTIDLEDWFHILAHEETSFPEQWGKFESRVEQSTDWILEALVRNKQRATFFCLGWIANRYPDLIKRIVADGHEIACHSMNHQLIKSQTPDEFKGDLTECIRLLEDISQQKIRTYRAPGFSLTENTKWIFEILIENGVENDCSVFPAMRNHGGFKNFPSNKPNLISVNGKCINEFPLNTASFWGENFVFSGGGYFRLLPYSIVRNLMTKGDYVMTYFHPRDFDSDQPVLSSLSMKRKFMSYVGVKGAKAKFEKLLSEFVFMNVRDASAQFDWDSAKKVKID